MDILCKRTRSDECEIDGQQLEISRVQSDPGLNSPQSTSEPFKSRVGETSIAPHMNVAGVSAPSSNCVTTILVGADEHRVNDEVIEALAGDPELFVRHGTLVRIVREDEWRDGIARPAGLPRIRVVPQQTLREVMTRQIQFASVKIDGEGNEVTKALHPPAWSVSAVQARGYWPNMRPLRGIVTCPVLRPDGSIVTADGYDPMTGTFLASEITFPQISLLPSQQDAIKAAELLLGVVADFPFARPEHRSAFLAMVLTPLSRQAFHGPCPLFAVDANIRGAGKSLLADIAGTITTGATLPRMSNPADDEECRKRITALAIAGDTMVLIDNVDGALGCPSFDAALTSPGAWKDRILGRSETVEMPLSLMWIATGNNLLLVGDTSRRTLHIRLESPEERPELRSGFRFPNLLEHVKQRRAELVAAALTVVSGYIAAGRPDMQLKPWGSFNDWSLLIRGAIVWCGLPDPGETREGLVVQSDSEAGLLRTIVNQLQVADPDNEGLTAAEMIRKAEFPQYSVLREAICELCGTFGDKLPTARSLGNKLKKFRGRVIDGKSLEATDLHGTARWGLREIRRATDVPAGGSGGSCGSESLPNLEIAAVQTVEEDPCERI